MAGFICGVFYSKYKAQKVQRGVRKGAAVISELFQVDGTPRGWRQLKHLRPCLDVWSGWSRAGKTSFDWLMPCQRLPKAYQSVRLHVGTAILVVVAKLFWQVMLGVKPSNSKSIWNKTLLPLFKVCVQVYHIVLVLWFPSILFPVLFHV